jgi:hypothetical protein
MAYNLRSRGPVEDVPDNMSEEEEDVDGSEDVSEEGSDVESDPFYGPFLENELLMNIGRIMRYELSRNIEVHIHQVQEDEEDEDEPPPPTTRVAPEDDESPLLAPPDVPPPPVPVSTTTTTTTDVVNVTDPTKLSAGDFEGLARYRLVLIAIRHFEHTGIRNVYTASSMPTAELITRLCQIPRGVAAEDCSICSFPLWDSTKLRCCGNNLCVHCMYRCTECPYCRSTEGF